MSESVVRQWFGPQFAALHPLLQELHERGGCLQGDIKVTTGAGLAGWVGRRLARALGVPLLAGAQPLRVDIHHDAAGLHWDRQFAGGSVLRSLFVPVGQWPTGYWCEQSGRVQLRLTVDVLEGGWYWRTLGLRVWGLPVPAFLQLRARAFKRIEQGRYRFVVQVALPLLGPVLAYEGLLGATLR